MQASYRINSPNVVAETLDREATIVDLEKGVYYALNESGSMIWDEVVGGATQTATAGAIARAYEIDSEEAERVVGALIDKFAEAGLIVENGDASSNGLATTADKRAATSNGGRSAYVEPKLSTYTDMQELLLLDPIHEVDDAGWPSRP